MAVQRHLAIDRPSTAGPPAHGDLVERLDGEVRERVRREGVDPQREVLVVRRIAEDVVRDHDQLSLTGAVAPIADDDLMVGELVARVSGFGPLQPFLDDPKVEEVWINDPSRVAEIRRVLRPEGQLLFLEHVRSSSSRQARWQDWLNPVWRAVACGCN